MTHAMRTHKRSSLGDDGQSPPRPSPQRKPVVVVMANAKFSTMLATSECRCYVRNGGAMSAVPTNVGVFFGQIDKRAEGWYWTDTRSEKLTGAIPTGIPSTAPFDDAPWRTRFRSGLTCACR
jgi:hypothetical protein